MLPQIPLRSRKSLSLGLQKEDKENYNNNIAPPGLNKLIRLKQPILQCNQPEKIINSLTIDDQKQMQDLNQILKQQYNKLIKKDYSQDILDALIQKNENIQDCLKDHSITSILRTKMVDWMIEVLSSYKISQQAFFRSTKYMDLFFKKTNRKLEVSDLHLVGISSMFIASKNQQIYPLKLNTIYDKICRKKFSKRQIIDMQQQILSTLQFQLQQTTCFDIVQHILGKSNSNTASLQLRLPQKSFQYLQRVSIYLGKMSMHCPELSQISNNKLSSAIIYISLKTVQQIEINLEADQFMPIIAELNKVTNEDLLKISQELLNTAKMFHKNHPNLTNLQKFNRAEYEE